MCRSREGKVPCGKTVGSRERIQTGARIATRIGAVYRCGERHLINIERQYFNAVQDVAPRMRAGGECLSCRCRIGTRRDTRVIAALTGVADEGRLRLGSQRERQAGEKQQGPGVPARDAGRGRSRAARRIAPRLSWAPLERATRRCLRRAGREWVRGRRTRWGAGRWAPVRASSPRAPAVTLFLESSITLSLPVCRPGPAARSG